MRIIEIMRRSLLSALSVTPFTRQGMGNCVYFVAALAAGQLQTAYAADAALSPTAVMTGKAPSGTNIKPTAKPEWQDLNATQQKALKPLALHWSSMSEGHKRKWLAMSQNFAALPLPEQALMHERMNEWATLSAQERSQARLNYAGVKALPSEERLAKWQAYQALSAEEKQHLAATAPAKLLGAAAAVKPVAPQRLTVTPTPVKSGDGSAMPIRTPKIAAAPNQVDHKTLLPQHVPPHDTASSQ